MVLLVGALHSGMITLEYDSNQYAIMFSQNQVYQHFYPTSDIWTCKSSDLFTYNQTQQEYVANSPYNMLVLGFDIDLTIQVTSRYSLLMPSTNQSYCLANQNCTIQIFNNCPTVNYFQYFDVLEIYVP